MIQSIKSIFEFLDEIQKIFCIIGVIYFFTYLQKENEEMERRTFENKRRDSL
jgi:hypothetical protein